MARISIEIKEVIAYVDGSFDVRVNMGEPPLPELWQGGAFRHYDTQDALNDERIRLQDEHLLFAQAIQQWFADDPNFANASLAQGKGVTI